MSIENANRHRAALAFIGLLILGVVWPAPIVEVNDVCCHARLPIDDLSFLGREAPSYDVLFWCIAGLVAIAIVQSGEWSREQLREVPRVVRGMRPRLAPRATAFGIAAAAVAVALLWRFADEPVTALAERVQSPQLEDAIRYANRFGGGMNPALVIGFLLLAGIAYRHRRWIEYAVAMAFSGLAAGLLVQIVKLAVGRTRPELWLGAFHHARTSASSFPSGHTVGAFALAGVLFVSSPSRAVRVAAFVVASAVGISRILAFRHWTSDVVASALLGTFAAIAVVTALTSEASGRP